MKNATRPAILKWRQTAPELILCAVRWYLRYSLSLRDIEELCAERSLEADHTTIWRWVQRYGPELEQRLHRHLKPTNKSWRVCVELLILAKSTIRHTQEVNVLDSGGVGDRRGTESGRSYYSRLDNWSIKLRDALRDFGDRPPTDFAPPLITFVE